MTLTEREISGVLHRIVADGGEVRGSAEAARRRARHIRAWRRRRMAGGAVLAAALLAAVPVFVARDEAPSRLPLGTAPELLAGSAAPGDCRTRTGCPEGTIPGELRRPLALPALGVGQVCPVSTGRDFPAGGGFLEKFSAIGEGPVYLVGGPTVSVELPPSPGSPYVGNDWSGAKVLWTVDASYSGPLLMRGQRIDGPQELRFDHYLGAAGYPTDAVDQVAYPDLAYPQNGGGSQDGPGYRTYPSAVRLQAPGCYAIQVDGLGFSTHIIFEAHQS